MNAFEDGVADSLSRLSLAIILFKGMFTYAKKECQDYRPHCRGHNAAANQTSEQKLNCQESSLSRLAM